jgi:hypothetical protein
MKKVIYKDWFDGKVKLGKFSTTDALNEFLANNKIARVIVIK